jgi:hypothetical protein
MWCPAFSVITTGWPPAANVDPTRSVELGELLVTRSSEGLELRSRDGRFQVPLRDALDYYLQLSMPQSLQIVQERHSPRIEVDDVVLAREQWQIAPPPHAEGFAGFVSARRWARGHGIPDRFFVSTPNEAKPLFIDLDAPHLVEIFLRLTRGQSTIRVSEMLPDQQDLWLRAGEDVYTCELRMCAVDPTPS